MPEFRMFNLQIPEVVLSAELRRHPLHRVLFTKKMKSNILKKRTKLNEFKDYEC